MPASGEQGEKETAGIFSEDPPRDEVVEQLRCKERLGAIRNGKYLC